MGDEREIGYVTCGLQERQLVIQRQAGDQGGHLCDFGLEVLSDVSSDDSTFIGFIEDTTGAAGLPSSEDG